VPSGVLARAREPDQNPSPSSPGSRLCSRRPSPRCTCARSGRRRGEIQDLLSKFATDNPFPAQGAELSDALEMVAGGFKDNNGHNARGGINTHVEVKLA